MAWASKLSSLPCAADTEIGGMPAAAVVAMAWLRASSGATMVSDDVVVDGGPQLLILVPGHRLAPSVAAWLRSHAYGGPCRRAGCRRAGCRRAGCSAGVLTAGAPAGRSGRRGPGGAYLRGGLRGPPARPGDVPTLVGDDLCPQEGMQLVNRPGRGTSRRWWVTTYVPGRACNSSIGPAWGTSRRWWVTTYVPGRACNSSTGRARPRPSPPRARRCQPTPRWVRPRRPTRRRVTTYNCGNPPPVGGCQCA